MKFGESLSEGLVPEWKQQYLNYKEGKKLIKKIDELRSVVREDDSTMNPPTSIDAMPFTTRRNTSRSGKRDPNDRTPLLGPIEEDSGAVEELESIDPKDATPARGGASLSFQQHDQPQHETASHSNSVSDLRLKRRPSFFNYSIRSSSREKQEQQKSDFNSGKTDFINWVDKELIKVDKFYLEKELEAYERFLILQDQLYQLKEHKAEVLMARLKNAAGAKGIEITNPDTIYKVSEITRHTRGAIEALNRFELPSLPSTTFWKKWRKHHSHNHKHSTTDDIALGSKKSEETDYEFDVNYDQNRIRNGQELLEREDELDDANSMGLSIDSELPHSETAGDITGYTGATGMHPGTSHGSIDGEVASRTSVDSINSNIAAKRQARRDYVKKNNQFRVPYVYARRQLKTALLEHYRALTLLKSFRVLNRTALRKITKKFDKSSGSSISEDFMKKVDHSYFQTSDLVDKLMTQVEELYIVFFDPESTDRKHSLEKLKSIAYTMNSLDGRPVSFYLPTFSDGICIGFGIPLMVLGLYVALNKTLLGELPEGKLLLQIWGGFFLLVLMLALFGINLMVFDYFKINYKFIFEFDLATTLNYKQFLVLPTFAYAFFSILFWFSFNNYWPLQFPGRDWPWIFFGTMLVIFFWPFNQFYGPSRKWLQVALWRLLLSGFYPVEFRDFFLGDIFCSLTYTMGNLSFYFCLYSHHWNGLLNGDTKDSVCGSSKSRLMGFFSTLPSIWRLLQCIRRYSDSGDWFPHLANMTKYGILTIYYMLLSIYRIEATEQHRAAFIAFATVNSLYSSVWDILMDWSLLQTGSKNYLLRDHLFFKRPIYYYLAMVCDVILRFQWIFYACFTEQIQQLAVTGFCVALAEIIRRFIWIFFRMENEHCTNVTLFRASRDSPIPYKVKHKVESAIKRLVKLRYEANQERKEDDILNKSAAVPPPILSKRRNFSVDQTKYYDEEADLGSPPTANTHIARGNQASTLGSANASTSARQHPPVSGSSQKSEFGSKLRRQSTFQTISSALNRAHVKDFQRRKTHMNVEQDSDDDELEDFN